MKKPLRKPRKAPVASTIVNVVDLDVDDLIESPENPQEMDDSTFDELVEGIKADGFNEPIHVIKHYVEDQWTGKYMITSGHHRTKAAIACGMTKIPAIIRKDMDEVTRKISLVRANMLRGQMNPVKFTELFNEVTKHKDAALLKKLMGFTKEEAFKKVYKEVSKALPSKQRKQLEKAEETIRSVDDLSSVLNTIFKEAGSDLTRGYTVFSFGGKRHHYFQIDKRSDKLLGEIEKYMETHSVSTEDMIYSLLSTFQDAGFRVRRNNKKEGDDE